MAFHAVNCVRTESVVDGACGARGRCRPWRACAAGARLGSGVRVIASVWAGACRLRLYIATLPACHPRTSVLISLGWSFLGQRKIAIYQCSAMLFLWGLACLKAGACPHMPLFTSAPFGHNTFFDALRHRTNKFMMNYDSVIAGLGPNGRLPESAITHPTPSSLSLLRLTPHVHLAAPPHRHPAVVTFQHPYALHKCLQLYLTNRVH